MSLSRTMLDLVEQVRREERARLAACVRAWGERLGDHIPDGTMFAELAAMIERADGAEARVASGRTTVPPDGLTYREWCAVMRAFNPGAELRVPACYVRRDEEPSPVEDEIARLFNAAQTVTTVRGRLGEHVVAPPFVLDLDE